VTIPRPLADRRPDRADDLELEINARGGLPLSLAEYLLRAVGAAYPHTQLKADGGGGPFGPGPTMTLLIPRTDLYEAEVSDEELAMLGGEKDVAELTAFTTGWRDGALGISPPSWLSTLLQHAAEQMVDAMSPAAENYVAITIDQSDGEPFTWIVCRPGRPSPHDLRRQAEAERDELRHALDVVLRDRPCPNPEDPEGCYCPTGECMAHLVPSRSDDEECEPA
jgi:hypothetical protein